MSLPVSDLAASKVLYDAMLGALGYRCVFHVEAAAGYDVEDGKDKLCLKQAAPAVAAGEGFHLAFGASSQDEVNAFHAAAIDAGASDNGAPGLRPDYGPDYYAAFVIDLDGHRLEAVFKE